MAPTRLGPDRRPLGILLSLGALLLFGRTPEVAGMDRPVVVATYQGPIREGDFSGNVLAARGVIARAREAGAQFLVFPECFLSGYETRAAVAAGARSHEDPDLQEFIRETATDDLVILIGLARRDGSRLFDSVVVLQHGQILGASDKIHLTADDRGVLGFQPGTSIPVYAAHGLRFAALVGADSSQWTAAAVARQQGAEVLFTSQYSEVAEPMADDHRRSMRNGHVGLAAQLRLAVVRSNVVKTQRAGQVGYGDSFVLSPQGEVLAESRLFKPGLLTATLTPDLYRAPYVWGNANDVPGWLRQQLADLEGAFRAPRDEADLRRWFENMLVYHRFSADEVSAATGLPPAAVAAEIKRLELDLRRRPSPGPGEPLRVLPYPGGRHPRLGFFDGAVAPQRETKVSVFTPWDDGGYVVVDVPEAIFSNLGLLYLAHTHVPTLWEQQGLTLPRLEWQRLDDGRYESARVLPNGVGFRSVVSPRSDGVRFELSLRNGTRADLTGLRVQNCVMLGRAPGFEAQSLTNKVFNSPFAAARSSDERHWVITGWERCQRTWGNPWVPCIHADPLLPDCPPGNTVAVRGWVSFYEGSDIAAELERLKTAEVLAESSAKAP